MPSPPPSNQLQRARKVLEALQRGIDPCTQEELPHRSIVNDIEVNRAIATAVLAIDQMEARVLRRAQLPGNVGRSWEKDEEDTLVASFKSGDSRVAIAARHGRTARAIEARLQKLGLMSAPEGMADKPFFTSTKDDNKNE